MLNIIYDFIPVLLFFFAFKFYGIYVATVVGIIATGLQVILTGILQRRIDNKQFVTFCVFVFFGGLTLYFHNPIFVKWKPTIIFWIFGSVLLISHFVSKKKLMQRMMEGVLEGQEPLPSEVWDKMNLAWAVFFIMLGGVNLYVAYTFTTDTWVNFKFYGILSLLIIFSFAQAIYLSRYITKTK